MPEKSLAKRGHDAAVAYIERAGMTVVEEDYTTGVGLIEVIALDDDTLVGFNVTTTRSAKGRDPMTPPSPAMIRKLDARMRAYMTDKGLDLPFRHDLITLLVIGEDRALLRHQRAWAVPS